MKFTATVCNIALFGFTCLVLLSDGISRDATYMVLTLLLLMVPVLSLFMIVPGKEGNGWFSFIMKRTIREDQGKIDILSSFNTIMKIAVVISNGILFGFSCWTLVSQYPHPEEEGLLLYTILVLLTPVLSVLAIFQTIEKKSLRI